MVGHLSPLRIHADLRVMSLVQSSTGFLFSFLSFSFLLSFRFSFPLPPSAAHRIGDRGEGRGEGCLPCRACTQTSGIGDPESRETSSCPSTHSCFSISPSMNLVDVGERRAMHGSTERGRKEL
ncbi:hypothetical protein LX36DRAFT_206 [Colletotrichum falcatum]|nr:hypothetical protein LX36DRAFT_206 [Colletotrichum falcatum]